MKFKVGDEVWVVTNWLEGTYSIGIVKSVIENYKIYNIECNGKVKECSNKSLFETEQKVKEYIESSLQKV